MKVKSLHALHARRLALREKIERLTLAIARLRLDAGLPPNPKPNTPRK